jgi:hypothetical protein
MGPALDRSDAQAFVTAEPVAFGKSPAEQLVESLIIRYPGSTARFLSRRARLSPEDIRKTVARLGSAGDIICKGPARQRAYYPATEGLFK